MKFESTGVGKPRDVLGETETIVGMPKEKSYFVAFKNSFKKLLTGI